MQTVDRLAAALQEVTLPPGEAARAAQVAGRVLAHRLSQLSDIGDPYASRTPSDAFLDKMTNGTSNWNGIRIFSDMQKSFAAVMVQDRMLKGVREFVALDERERAYLQHLSIDQGVAARIAAQFARYGEQVEGIHVANTLAWTKDNAGALRAYRSAVNKDVASLVAKDAGSQLLLAGTPVGQAMLAFKDFTLASYQRLLLRRLEERQSRFVGGLVAMTAMGMFAAWMRSDRPGDLASDPERWIGAGFDRSGITAVPLELSDAFEKATGFNPVGPFDGADAAHRLLPYNAYPGIRQMLGFVLHPQD
jgi:hypothetical protein